MPDVFVKVEQQYTGGGSAKVYAAGDYNKYQLMSGGLPPFTESSRLGNSFVVGTSTLFAPLVAFPSTTAAFELYNNGLRTLIITDLYAAQILSTAASQTYGIYGMVTTRKAAPTLTALSIFGQTGRAIITPTAASELITGVGTTVVANGWQPWGTVQAWGTATATPGNSWSVPVDGKIIVPPACSVCLHIVGALATASTFQVGLRGIVNGLTVEA